MTDKEKHIHCSFYEKAAIQNRAYKNRGLLVISRYLLILDLLRKSDA
jgi:hypothetical protein